MFANLIQDRGALHEYLSTEDPDKLIQLKGEIEEYHGLTEMLIEALGHGTNSPEFKSKDVYKTWIDGGYEAKGKSIGFNPEISEEIEAIEGIRNEYVKVFYEALSIHDAKLAAKLKFNEEYEKEQEIRHSISDTVYKLNDSVLFKDIGEISYLSKEALFQYRDEKHINEWYDAITTLKTDVEASQNVLTSEEQAALLEYCDEYYVIARTVGNLALDIRQKETDELAKLAEIDKYISTIDETKEKIDQVVMTSVNDTRTSATTWLLSVLGVSIILGLGISYFTSRSILKPLIEVRNGAIEISQGNLDKRVGVTTDDEVGELASVFNEMASRLKDSYMSLEEKRSDLQKALTELEELDRLKGDIISNVSHELKTPISIMQGNIELALEEEEQGEKNKLLKSAISALRRQERIINDLLAVTEMGLVNPIKKPEDIEPLIEGVVMEKFKMAESKGIRIKWKIDRNFPLVPMEYESIEQVLMNLIDNAIKFNKENGKVIIKARKMDDFIEISVSDTGIGIEDGDMEKLFKPLTQLDPSARRRYGGTGTGLAVGKRIVEAHGGKIWAETNYWKGSTFYLTLPLENHEIPHV